MRITDSLCLIGSTENSTATDRRTLADMSSLKTRGEVDPFRVVPRVTLTDSRRSNQSPEIYFQTLDERLGDFSYIRFAGRWKLFTNWLDNRGVNTTAALVGTLAIESELRSARN
jgi:hypothetical protein